MTANILNVARHRCESPTILGWMLWRWQRNPAEPLMIICEEKRADAIENLLRVKLSQIRESMKEQGITDYKRFGFKAKKIGWTTLEGERLEALCLTRVVELRHVFGKLGGFAALAIPVKEPTNGN